MHNFQNLRVYHLAVDFAVDLYKYTKTLPSDERYGLVSQLNRNAVSVPSNISEVSGRTTNKDFANSISIAIGSAFEIETQLVICKRLDHSDPSGLIDQIQGIQRQLIVFKATLKLPKSGS